MVESTKFSDVLALIVILSCVHVMSHDVDDLLSLPQLSERLHILQNQTCQRGSGQLPHRGAGGKSQTVVPG